MVWFSFLTNKIDKDMNDLYFQMIRNGIEELRNEKYQSEKNGMAKALQITLNNLQDSVKKLTIPVVIKSEAAVYCDCDKPKYDCGICTTCDKYQRF